MSESPTIIHGDCLAELRKMADSSIDAIVTDPPYGLSQTRPDKVADTITRWATGEREYVPGGKGFMGKAWDSFVPPPAVWDECMRVLKPGGHLLVFAGSRTQDLMGLSIRLAGFEIRDGIGWITGSGFPKSQNVHKVSLNRVISRYGTSRCNCMDTGDGRRSRHEFGQEGGGLVRDSRGQSQVPPPETRDTDLPVNTSSPGDDVCELRGGDTSQTKGSSEVPETVLLPDMRTRGAETSGHGHPAVRPGMEEQEGRGQAAGHEVPILRDHAGGERERATRASSSPLPVRGDQPPGESGGPVQLVPPRDRGGDQPSVGHDPGRREPRRVSLDGEGRRGDPVARVCSWCGLPDPEWLRSLEGLGSALKPAIEPVIVARKPIKGTVAANVLEWGTGALNIDASRVPTGRGDDVLRQRAASVVGDTSAPFGRGAAMAGVARSSGRWPANVLLDPEAAAAMDEQSGTLPARGNKSPTRRNKSDGVTGWGVGREGDTDPGDSGGASRFFPVFKYQAKAPKRERPVIYYNECECDQWQSQPKATAVSTSMGEQSWSTSTSGNSTTGQSQKATTFTTSTTTNSTIGSRTCSASAGSSTNASTQGASCATESGGSPAECAENSSLSVGTTGISAPKGGPSTADAGSATSPRWYTTSECESCGEQRRRVQHCTVKPLELMRWLVRLVTPSGGIVLDPFAGSGTTLEAALMEGFTPVGIEAESDYIPLIEARLSRVEDTLEATL